MKGGVCVSHGEKRPTSSHEDVQIKHRGEEFAARNVAATRDAQMES
jgi:hypothetical protein